MALKLATSILTCPDTLPFQILDHALEAHTNQRMVDSSR